MATTTHATGAAIDAYRALIRAELTVEQRSEELIQLLANDDIDVHQYAEATSRIDHALDEVAQTAIAAGWAASTTRQRRIAAINQAGR